MHEKLNLHLGCGTVYLNGYLNLDAEGHSPKQRPDLLATNNTSIEKYYKYPYVLIPFGSSPKRNVVVDVKANGLSLPFKGESLDSILTVNLVNHLRFQDMSTALAEWNRVLKPDGKLIIDVDDVVEMSRAVVEAKTNDELSHALRYLYCHSRTEFDSHRWGYTAEYLTSVVEPFGFNFDWRDDEYIHHDADYPHFIVCYSKCTSIN